MHVVNWLKYYPQNFCAVGSFYGSNIFMLKFKHDDGFSPYSMPEVFNKTGHGLTDIVIAWAEFKPVLHREFFGQTINTSTEY